MASSTEKDIVFQSPMHTADSEWDAVETLMAEGKTDGLPVIPPTPDRVASLLEEAELEPNEIVGTIPERQRALRAETIAVNAVMAGCSPPLMPVVTAAVRAVCDPRFSVHGPTATTAGTAVLVVVNGPIVEEFGFRSGGNLFAPGNRMNATVGRALHLLLRNAGGARREEFDRATLSHPGRYSYCIAEDPTDPWTPFHVQRGFEPSDSTVTVFAAEAPNQVFNSQGETAESKCATIASRLSSPGIMGLHRDSEIVVVIGQEQRGIIQRDGWEKEDVQQYIAQHAFCTVAECKEAGVFSGAVEEGDHEDRVYYVEDPEHVFVLAAGGQAGPWSCVVPGWTGRSSCQAVTLGIPGHARPKSCEIPISEPDGDS